MRSPARWHVALGLAALLAAGPGARAQQHPHIGYIYPAGGRRGTKLQVTVGGQYLSGVTGVYLSGRGVQATVLKHRPSLSGGQINNLQMKLREIATFQTRIRALTSPLKPQDDEDKDKGKEPEPKTPEARKADARKAARLGLLVARARDQFEVMASKAGLDDPTPRGFAALQRKLSDPKRQPNAQIDENVTLRVTLAPDAEPGAREFRLKTSSGVTNPLFLHVGQCREYYEKEPNDRTPDAAVLTGSLATPKARTPEAMSILNDDSTLDDDEFDVDLPNLESLPVVLNGQILPGDVDRFRFHIDKGTRLVAAVSARRLVPYLADAVPGWFQAVITLYDPKGNELAYADDFRFHPDPAIYYEVPEDGEYILEIRDSIYRGREDFVYRVVVGEVPFITHVFPLGGRAGGKTVAALHGWNLPTKQLLLDTRPGGDCIRHTVLRQGKCRSNSVVYAVDALSESNEAEPNDTARTAQRVALPLVLNGRIARPGDVDVFRFRGRAGDGVVAEVQARCLQSPLDSLLRLTDASGHVLAWNDDYVRKEGYLHKGLGVITHHADSYLLARLPKDGVYYVHLADTQHHGGDAYSYRLRIGAPEPDFAPHVSPSTLTVPAGGVVPFTVHALRKDGFEGDVELALKGAPAGFALSGARIPRGSPSVRLTLTAPRRSWTQPIVLHLEGRAQIDGKTVRRPAVPSDNVMQAFLYRHLVPTTEWMVLVGGGGGSAPPLKLLADGPLKLPAGGTAQARFSAPKGPFRKQVRLELSDPPKGIAIQKIAPDPQGVAIALSVDADKAKPGLRGNLIVNAFRETVVMDEEGKPTDARRRTALGPLPAIPFGVVAVPGVTRTAQKPAPN